MLQHYKRTNSPICLGWIVALAGVLGLSCSSEPAGPRQGTPEWLVQAASDNLAAGDYAKTVEQLGEAAGGPGDMAAKATLWLAAMRAGLAYGYDELADAFAAGMEENEAAVEDFQPMVSEYRRRTKVHAIDFAEDVGDLENLIGEQPMVAFDFPLPPGNASISPILASVEGGNKVDARLAAMESQTLTRGIFLAVAGLTGEDVADLAAMAGSEGGIQADADRVRVGIARTLLDIAIMFDRENINEPKVRSFVVDLAEKWVAPHRENESFAAMIEDFDFDLENERRDMSGKRKVKKAD
ncbi:MAG: hypothetical protein OXD30_11795 [Bryobacterales bacterium]|nr:hypothetical protein [Bryobacterales bacterium]